MHNYHDIHGHLPPAYTVSDEGERLHSWRVHLLPFLEEQPLFQQIKLDEPWNSPANQQRAQQMPDIFRCPSDPDRGPYTDYLVVVGDETLFTGSEPVKFVDVIDGLSNTIMVVEAAGSNINWMEPQDLDFDTLPMQINAGPNSISSHHPRGAQVLMGDGSVRFLNQDISPDVLRGLLTKAGGESVRLE